MTKYVIDKNGLYLGYDNMFVYWDENDVIQHFMAVVGFEILYPKNVNILTCNLKSFATQMVWKNDITGATTTLSEWWVDWLNEHIGPGQWGIPPYGTKNYAKKETPTVFFKKVKGARLFKAKVTEMLLGMPSVKSATIYYR